MAADFQLQIGITVISLIGSRNNLPGVAFGHCISDLLQNISQLQRLALARPLHTETIRSFQPGLRANRHLKILDFSHAWRNGG